MGINIIIYHFIHLDLTADSPTVFCIMLLLIPISTIWFEYILLPFPCGLPGFLTIRGPICSQNICSVVECLALCRLWQTRSALWWVSWHLTSHLSWCIVTYHDVVIISFVSPHRSPHGNQVKIKCITG